MPARNDDMLCITDNTTDPYWNLAAEEFIVDNFGEPVFRLWRNAPSVIIGRNQNAAAEINRDFVRERGIAVVRRLTGGGAVFHDLGNVNFTFVDAACSGESANDMFRRFTAPIIGALRKLGVNASLEGRNDITVDGAKISGNAMCIRQGRVLQHGTLLFSSKMADLSGALLPRPEKYAGRGVQSVRSRVTNISEHLPAEMQKVEDFFSYLLQEVGKSTVPYSFSEEEVQRIEALAASKYRTADWNWGLTAGMSGATHRRKFDGGLLEADFEVVDGRIRNLKIYGDYFFTRPTVEFCTLLEGCAYDRKAVTDLLGTVTVNDWFCGISAAEIAELLFI